MAPTRIFITGAGGFIGRALRRADPRIVPVPRDAAAFVAAQDGEGPARLIHLAWPNLRSAALGEGPDDAQVWRRFVRSSVALRQACLAKGVGLIGVGSGIEAYVDADLAEPYRSYARRKLELKDELGPDSWLRLHFLFGTGEPRARLVPDAIRAAQAGEPLICGARDRRRHWASIEDIAPALLDFALAPKAGDFDIAGREPISFEDLLGLVREATGHPLAVTDPKTPLADAHLSLIAPRNLAPNLPSGLGTRANLLARLSEYAVLIAALGDGV